MKSKHIFWLLMVVLMFALATGCTQDSSLMVDEEPEQQESEKATQHLRVGLGDWMPYQRMNPSTGEAEGLLVQLLKTAMEECGYTYSIRFVPNVRRNEIEWGKTVFAELGVIPRWREPFADTSLYTVPVLTTRNVVLARKGTLEKTTSIHPFYGRTIGTNLGYHYDDGFQEAFQEGKIIREDTTEGESLFEKLKRSRVDAVIADYYEAVYWIYLLGYDWEDFEVVYGFQEESHLKFRLHTDMEHMLEPLNEALQATIRSDSFQQLVDGATR